MSSAEQHEQFMAQAIEISRRTALEERSGEPFGAVVVRDGVVIAAEGNSDLLVQRAIRGVGHCGFTATELITAFADLVAWVEYGVKPAGDNWLDPAEVASPTFGCAFTDFATPGGHILPTPCP